MDLAPRLLLSDDLRDPVGEGVLDESELNPDLVESAEWLESGQSSEARDLRDREVGRRDVRR